jgi:8-oxo-dGTP pyrophosphatase MutT (NUDIX family)
MPDLPENHATLPEMLPAPRFDLRLHDEPWPFALHHAARIDQHWQQQVALNPKLFNGRVLLAIRSGFRPDGTFFGDHVAVDFKAFLAWRDWGFQADQGRNIFGSALIRPSDGGLIMGRMAQHTSNPGLIYPPSGTLDLGDVAADGSIDIEASMARELMEETGLRAADLAPKSCHIIIEDIARICVARVFETSRNGAEIMAEIRANLAQEPEPELEDVVHVRRDMPLPDSVFLPYVKAMVRALA